MIYLKDIVNNNPEGIRYFSNSFDNDFEKFKEELATKGQQHEALREETERNMKKFEAEMARKVAEADLKSKRQRDEMEQFHKQFEAEYEEARRRFEADLRRKKQPKRPLKEKLAGFSKDLINSAKKAGRDAKAGLLRGMRKLS